MKKETGITVSVLGLASLILVGGFLFLTPTPAQNEALISPIPARPAATHAAVNDSIIEVIIPLVDPNGVVVEAVRVRITKEDLEPLTNEQKQKVRDFVVLALREKGIIN